MRQSATRRGVAAFTFTCAAALMSAPLPAGAQEPGPAVEPAATLDGCRDRAQALMVSATGRAAEMAADAFQAAAEDDLETCRDLLAQAETVAADQRAAAAGQAVRQPAPNVTVEQRKPAVNLVAPEPEVVVERAQPEVNVQQAEPEITFQQGEPDVTVQQQDPQIELTQPEPEVVVEQAEPEVVFERAEPNVTVIEEGAGGDTASAGAEVDYIQPEPEVEVIQPEPSVTIIQEGVGGGEKTTERTVRSTVTREEATGASPAESAPDAGVPEIPIYLRRQQAEDDRDEAP